MSATWGNRFKITLFGESHGAAIGVVIDGVPAGIKLDVLAIERDMLRRSAKGKEGIATARREEDKAEIVSGYFNGYTTGMPLTAVIRNGDTRSADYARTASLMRPGHSDYGYYVKSGGFNDYRGGGSSSGRLTAPMVFAGAVAKQILAAKGVKVGAHILSVADVRDSSFDTIAPQLDEVDANGMLDSGLWKDIKSRVEAAAADGDSVGGVIECAVCGLKAGVGEPLLDSVESAIAHMMFSVPAVKGIQFGLGYAMCGMMGSEVNDSFYYDGDDVATRTNNNGGVLGGITTGMPVIFNVAIKPTASIFKAQDTIDVSNERDARLELRGRHDPCIVLRAVPVIEAAAAISICDLTV